MVIQPYWDAAQIAGGISGIKAEILYCQWYHETAGFTSELCLKYNNLAGVTQTQPNDLPQPDGDYYYMQFDDLRDWARYFGKFIRLFDGVANSTDFTIPEYATALKEEGYFGDTLENYIAGMTVAWEISFGEGA